MRSTAKSLMSWSVACTSVLWIAFASTLLQAGDQDIFLPTLPSADLRKDGIVEPNVLRQSVVGSDLRPLPKGVPHGARHVTDVESPGFFEVIPKDAESSRNVDVADMEYWESAHALDDDDDIVFEPLDGHYKIGIGDRLLVSIYGEPNTERDILVEPSGTISYPIVGTIGVTGMTIDELRFEMNERLRRVYRYALINITPIQFGGQHYTILGEVSQPGKKNLLGKETVLSAICQAGGFTSGVFRSQTRDLADLEHAFLLRDGDYIPVDFETLVTEGNIQEDVELKGGDYIYIPSALEKEIFILGEVPAPTALGYVNQVTLTEAIAQAGGVSFNASSRAVVVRGSLKEPYTFHIDINRIFKGCEPDFMLRPGDIVYVPPRQFSYLRQMVQYAVNVFTSTLVSEAGTRAWTSIHGGIGSRNVNVIPSASSSSSVTTTSSSGGGGSTVVPVP